MLGRPLTREEGADLETALRERLAGAPTGGSLDFGEAVLAGRLGPVRSPGLAPRRPTRGAIVEDGLASGFTAATEGQLGRMPVVESREAFERLLVDFARTVPFGAKRLDGGNS